jgi:two-component system, NarL family, response regulator DevR
MSLFPARSMLHRRAMIRVLVLEPDPWRHRGLSAILEDAGTFEVSAERDYGRILTLTTPPEDLRVDVVAIAHRLVLEYGVAIIALIRHLFDPCSVIVHGEVDSNEVAAQVYAAGGRGYFVLSQPPGLYPKAVTVVAAGKFWGSREAVALMAEKATAARAAEEVEPPPPDEKQILGLLNEGLSNKEIGQRLGLAEATVKARFNRLYKKYGVATRLQLLAAAMKKGLIRQA